HVESLRFPDGSANAAIQSNFYLQREAPQVVPRE
ncbi:hypothetical protein CPC197_0752B, partial [Chlamydia psittaci C1/97]